MDKNSYINSEIVQAFVVWMLARVHTPGIFHHSYTMKKPKKEWECGSLFSAYENYCWNFRYIDASGKAVSGSTFAESDAALSSLSNSLKESLIQKDNERCISACRCILDWGGVKRGNYDKIHALDDKACEYFIHAQSILNTDKDLKWYANTNLFMSSGFTKIYSLLANDFIIYDSRVGAALCAFARDFCEENKSAYIPKELCFSWGILRGHDLHNNPRCPDSGQFKFSLINPHSHLQNNIMANWLLGELLRQDTEAFGALPDGKGLRALEAALFMVGYNVWPLRK